MLQNQDGINPWLRKFEFLASLGPQKKKRRFKSKRDSARKLSSKGCDHDCINHPRDEHNKDLTKASPTGRKRLHNVNLKLYFCSVPSCSFSSQHKRTFVEHYGLCYKTHQEIEVSKSRSTNYKQNKNVVQLNFEIPETEPFKVSAVEKSINSCDEVDITDINLNLAAEVDNLDDSMLPINEILNDNKGTDIGRTIDNIATCKTYELPSRVKRKMTCNECGLTFSRRKKLKTHLKTCSNQENSIERAIMSSKDDGISNENRKTIDVKRNYSCSVCSKEFKLNIALKKHFAKAHFKTTNVWNGQEFGNVVQISLAPKSANKEKFCKDSYDAKDEKEESEPVNKQTNSNECDKFIGQKQELVTSTNNEYGVENVFEFKKPITRLVTFDSNHELPEINFMSRKNAQKETKYHNYLWAILRTTTSKIFKDKLRKRKNKSQKQIDEKVPKYNTIQSAKIFNSLEDDKKIVTKEVNENEDQDKEDTNDVKSTNDVMKYIISSLQSFSLSMEKKFILGKADNSVQPSTFDSKRIRTLIKDNEIQTLHDEFIYLTVMGEILRNEARIILEKVIL